MSNSAKMLDRDAERRIRAAVQARSRQLPAPAEARRIRQESGLSLKEFARLLGVGAASLSSWETSRRRPTGLRRDRYVQALELLERHSAE